MSKCPCSSEEGFEKLGTKGSPYEGGSIYLRCKSCGRIKTRSEDGTMWLMKGGDFLGFRFDFETKEAFLNATAKEQWDFTFNEGGFYGRHARH